MFDDPRKELRRLEEQLLAEEDPGPDVPEDTLWLDDELEEARRLLGDETPDDEEEEDEDPEPMVYRNFANGYGRRQSAPVRNRDRFDRDLEEYSDQVHDEPREKGVRGLVILACLELLGILGILGWWMVWLM